MTAQSYDPWLLAKAAVPHMTGAGGSGGGGGEGGSGMGGGEGGGGGGGKGNGGGNGGGEGDEGAALPMRRSPVTKPTSFPGKGTREV